MNKIITLIALLVLSFLIFSCQDEIALPTPCTEEPDLPFNQVYVHIYTDVDCGFNVTVDKKGFIWGDSIIVKRNNITKISNIAGYICKDRNFYMNAFYYDANDKSRFKIEGQLAYNSCTGTISYCPNSDNNCKYTVIGSFNTSYSGTEGRGSFSTPLFSGEIIAYTQSNF